MRDETAPPPSTLLHRLAGHDEEITALICAITVWMERTKVHTLTVKRTGGKTTMTLDARDPHE